MPDSFIHLLLLLCSMSLNRRRKSTPSKEALLSPATPPASTTTAFLSAHGQAPSASSSTDFNLNQVRLIPCFSFRQHMSTVRRASSWGIRDLDNLSVLALVHAVHQLT